MALRDRLRRCYRKQGRPVLVPEFRGLFGQVPPEKGRNPMLLPASFAGLPPGQRRVAVALVDAGIAPTYEQVAHRLGLHLGTVLGYVNRIRSRRPEAYADLVVLRRRQLAERHQVAVQRAAQHSAGWHRRQANRRYRERFGIWPWER